MEFRTIITGIVVTVIVLVFITLGLRSCTRGGSSSSASVTNGGTTRGSSDSTDHLIACTADPKTGFCFPREGNRDLPFDWDNFMVTVREHQLNSSSSSSSSVMQRTSNPATSRVTIIGADDGSEGTGASGGSNRTRGAGNSRRGNAAGGDAFNGGVSLQGSNDNAGDSSGEFDTGESGVIVDDDGQSDGTADGSGNGGNGSGTGGGSNGGGYQGYGGLRGSIGSLPSGRCHRGRSFVGIFDPDDVTTGAFGMTVPVLIDGDCPVTGAMLKGPELDEGFGGALNDF